MVLTGTGLAGALVGCLKKGTSSSDDSAFGNGGSTDDSGTTATGGGTEGGTEGGTGGGTTGGTGASTGTGGEPPDECTLTDSDIPGPFYVEDVPVRSELDLYGDPGTELTLAGFVLDTDCNPIPNAVVDVWHADPTTVAVEDLTAADSVDYDNTSSEMRYRGQIATDADGRYSFHTKKPGWYLNGDSFRPMHIHVKIWVDGTERLTTQLYFDGDPHIEGDPWASADRSIVLTSDGSGGEVGNFDFTVDVS